MKDIILTEKQEKAKNLAIQWWNDEEKIKKPFVLAGIAGSGKSTVISSIVEALCLTNENVAYCAYTGMAATVLIKKGLDATTIHRLIYDYYEVYNNVTKKKEIKFKLKEKLDKNIKLIIVDEVSMVSNTMMEELEYFGVPIIACGDPFQLQPIYGDVTDYLKHPDYFLDEPLRQALNNPIIKIANDIRKGIKPKVGDYGKVRVFSKNNFPEEILYEADQILAGKNKTVENFNKLIRYKKGYKTLLPQEGEKIICIKNNWNYKITEGGHLDFDFNDEGHIEYIEKEEKECFLVNGLIGNVSNVYFKPKSKTFKMDFKPNFFEDNEFKGLIGDYLLLENPACKDDEFIKEHHDFEYKMRLGTDVNKFQYGYCITVYKSQGSEFPYVVYFDEFLSKSTYFQHMYTAVTRATDRIDIII